MNNIKKQGEKIYYYKTFNDDIIKSKNQDYKLDENYKWIHSNIFYKLCSKIVYAIAYVLGFFYYKFALQVKIENGAILKRYKKQGYFLYGNHTQPIGDIFIPAFACKTKRIYVVVSPANLGVIGVGKILPMLGALPIPNSIKGNEKLFNAIVSRIKERKCVVIYPEAHVWPYYTKIRPFPKTSFKYPVYCNVPSFCITTTYYKRKFRKKPGIKVFVDGPFVPNQKLTKKENQEKICKEIYECMVKRSKSSTYEYIKYKKE